MPTQVLYPKVSLELSSGKISQWLVAEGDAVAAGQILYEIENDKAAVEVESPAAGIIRNLVAAGTEVDVGAAVASIYETDAAFAAAATPAPVRAAQAEVTPVPVAAPVKSAGHGLRPTPLARRIARDQNISIEGMAGSGPRGRVQKKDVLALLQNLAHGTVAPPAQARPVPRDAGLLNHAWLRRGSGVPLVLLHGFSADLQNWRGMFAGNRFDNPVLALDLPGHGQSPRDIPASLEAVAAQVEQTIAAATDGPILLAGHSFGSVVATRVAALGGLDLRGLCLFAPAGLGPEINGAFIDGILRAREAASLRPWLTELVYDPALISDAYAQVVAEERRDQGLTDAMRAFGQRFFPDGTQSQSILADLARITLPVRVVFGRNDRILPFARTADLPGNVALHALAACGHMPHLEHPALALRILSDMLRGA